MTLMTLAISDPRYDQLRALAERAGLTPDEFLRQRVDHLLDQETRFAQASDHVLEKNAELYRRLA